MSTSFTDLREFIAAIEGRGELARVKVPVDPRLEMTEITDRVVKQGGPALVFENPTGYEMPVAINLFGTEERTCLGLGVEHLDDLGTRIKELLKIPPVKGITEKLRALGKLKELKGVIPKSRKSGPAQEVVETSNPSLADIPVMTCWPGDAGPFITFPLVITKDPETGERNVGCYRMQVFDERTTGMHWQAIKDGTSHYRKAERMGLKRLDVAVAIGADPALCYAATAPLPSALDEVMLAGFIRGRGIELCPAKTVDLTVPCDAEIVLEGYVQIGETRVEGPFGDHTGYYSPAWEYPVFHLTAVTHRRDPIYHSIIVGVPPQEDCYLGKATERIFLPMIQMQLPEIVDLHLPFEGVFHNLAIVSIDKTVPRQAHKAMHAIWGLGQLATNKVTLVVDAGVDVQNLSEVAWRVLNNIDPKRDVIFSEGILDDLDHSSPTPLYGSKMGIDATAKLPGEDHDRGWPEDIEMSAEIKERVAERWQEYFDGLR